MGRPVGPFSEALLGEADAAADDELDEVGAVLGYHGRTQGRMGRSGKGDDI